MDGKPFEEEDTRNQFANQVHRSKDKRRFISVEYQWWFIDDRNALKTASPMGYEVASKARFQEES